MNHLIENLSLIRQQLTNQQSSINDLIFNVDKLILNELRSNSDEQIPNKIIKVSLNKQFPEGINSKRDKLKYILTQSSTPLTAKEIKQKLSEYNENLSNVDQSLVNLEANFLISSSKNEEGRKQYFIK